MNPSDLNSKIPANLDVIEICNSEFWRHGPPCILDQDYPKSDDIFMTVKKGEYFWLQYLAEKNNCLRVNSSLCPVHTQIFCIHSDCVHKQLSGVKVPADNPLGQTSGQISATHNLVNNAIKCFTGIQVCQPLSRVNILELLPLLLDSFYNFLLNNFNLQRIIIKIGKILMFALPTEIIKQVGLVSQWSDGPLSIGHGRNMTNVVRKICFLTLIKCSNKLFPVTAKLKSISVAGINLVYTRYTIQAQKKIFQTIAVPAIGKDDRLFFLIYMQSHITTDSSSPAHVPPFLTIQRMTTGPFAVITLNQKRLVSNLVRSCPKCLLKNQTGRPYEHSPKDPRILQFLD